MRMSIEKNHMKQTKKSERLFIDQLRDELAAVTNTNKRFVDDLAYCNAVQSQPQTAEEPSRPTLQVSDNFADSQLHMPPTFLGDPDPQRLKTGAFELSVMRPKSGSKISRRNSRSVINMSAEVAAVKVLELEELVVVSLNAAGFLASLGRHAHMGLPMVERSLDKVLVRLRDLSERNAARETKLSQIYTQFAWKKECLARVLRHKTEAEQEQLRWNKPLEESEVEKDSVKAATTQPLALRSEVDLHNQANRNRLLWLAYLHCRLVLGRFGLSVQAINTVKVDQSMPIRLKELSDSICKQFYGIRPSAQSNPSGKYVPQESISQANLLLDSSEGSKTLVQDFDAWFLKQTMMVSDASSLETAYDELESKVVSAFEQILELMKLLKEESQRRRVNLYMLTGKSESTSNAVLSLKGISRKVKVISEATEVTEISEHEASEGSVSEKLKEEHTVSNLDTTDTANASRLAASQGPLRTSIKMNQVADLPPPLVSDYMKKSSTFYRPQQFRPTPSENTKTKPRVKFADRISSQKPFSMLGRSRLGSFSQSSEGLSASGALRAQKHEKSIERITERLAIDLNSFSPAAQRAKGFKLLLKDYFQQIRGMKEEPDFNFKNLEPTAKGSDVKGLHRSSNSGKQGSEERGAASADRRGNSSEFRVTSFRREQGKSSSSNHDELPSLGSKELRKSVEIRDNTENYQKQRPKALRLSLQRSSSAGDQDLRSYLFADTTKKPNKEGLLPVASAKLLKDARKAEDRSLFVRKPLHRTVLSFQT